MTAPILECRDLSVSFGGVRALDGVSAAVERNRITTIIGPNGAGKSTLFNVISGAIRPDGGRVLIDGDDVTGASSHRLQRAGLSRSFQITNLFFDLSVRENLRLAAQVLEPSRMALRPLAASRIARERVEELLNWFQLQALGRLPVRALSHGDQRRLEIAVALAGNPKLLLLDEPTQGMSHANTREAAEMIRSLVSKVTILLIEHDIGLVMDLADHVIVMHQGKVLAQGSPRAMRDDPAVQAAYFGNADARHP
jgi:branched-chain amino acid transport system ATP-binding protein